jgi:hypothetical protein
MADLQEKRSDFPGAIGYYRKAYERYGFAANLVACLMRYQQATGRTDYAGLLQQVLGKALPQGLVRIEAGKFSGPPKKGVVIVEVRSRINGGLDFSWSTSIPGITSARATVAEYPLDGKVDVFYWPRFPGIACLRPGRYCGGITLAILGVIVVVASVVISSAVNGA